MYLKPACLFFCFALFIASAVGQGGDTIVKGHVTYLKTKRVKTSVLTFSGTDGKIFKVLPDTKGDYAVTRDMLVIGSVYLVHAEITDRTCLNMVKKFSIANGFPEKPIILDFEFDCGGCGPFWPPNIYFEPDVWELNAVTKIGMDVAVELMNNDPTLIIQIQGHAETSEKNPMKIALKRAEAAMKYLTDEGIAKERIVAVAFGDTAYRKLISDVENFHAGDILSPEFIAGLRNPEDIKTAKALNRYVDFRRISWDYEPKK